MNSVFQNQKKPKKMKIVETKNFIKLAKKKKKKEWDPNPWAVCETSVGKKKNPKKFERCVKKVKDKQKTASKTDGFSIDKERDVEDHNSQCPVCQMRIKGQPFDSVEKAITDHSLTHNIITAKNK